MKQPSDWSSEEYKLAYDYLHDAGGNYNDALHLYHDDLNNPNNQLARDYPPGSHFHNGVYRNIIRGVIEAHESGYKFPKASRVPQYKWEKEEPKKVVVEGKAPTNTELKEGKKAIDHRLHNEAMNNVIGANSPGVARRRAERIVGQNLPPISQGDIDFEDTMESIQDQLDLKHGLPDSGIEIVQEYPSKGRKNMNRRIKAAPKKEDNQQQGPMQPMDPNMMAAQGMQDPNQQGTQEQIVDPSQQMSDQQPTQTGEPMGAQILRRVHQDHSILMQEYDEMLNMLEHPEVKNHLVQNLQRIEMLLQDTENIFAEVYGHLPGIDGSQDPNQGMSPDDPSIEGYNDKGPEPTPDEAFEGMERDREERYGKNLRREVKGKYTCPRCQKKSCICGVGKSLNQDIKAIRKGDEIEYGYRQKVTGPTGEVNQYKNPSLYAATGKIRGIIRNKKGEVEFLKLEKRSMTDRVYTEDVPLKEIKIRRVNGRGRIAHEQAKKPINTKAETGSQYAARLRKDNYTRKKELVNEEDDYNLTDHLCPNCQELPCLCDEDNLDDDCCREDGACEELEEGEYYEDEADKLEEAAFFLNQLGDKDSLDEEIKCKAYHYHKCLEPIVNTFRKNVEISSMFLKSIAFEKAFGELHKQEAKSLAKALNQELVTDKEEGLDEIKEENSKPPDKEVADIATSRVNQRTDKAKENGPTVFNVEGELVPQVTSEVWREMNPNNEIQDQERYREIYDTVGLAQDSIRIRHGRNPKRDRKSLNEESLQKVLEEQERQMKELTKSLEVLSKSS